MSTQSPSPARASSSSQRTVVGLAKRRLPERGRRIIAPHRKVVVTLISDEERRAAREKWQEEGDEVGGRNEEKRHVPATNPTELSQSSAKNRFRPLGGRAFDRGESNLTDIVRLYGRLSRHTRDGLVRVPFAHRVPGVPSTSRLANSSQCRSSLGPSPSGSEGFFRAFARRLELRASNHQRFTRSW